MRLERLTDHHDYSRIKSVTYGSGTMLVSSEDIDWATRLKDYQNRRLLVGEQWLRWLSGNTIMVLKIWRNKFTTMFFV